MKKKGTPQTRTETITSVDERPDETDTITSVDELPDDPLSMPPPYWRGSSAIFHVLDSLNALEQLLSDLMLVNEKTRRELEKHYEKFPRETNTDEEQEEFGNICDDLWAIEHKIILRCENAILMSAISAEDQINQFCVFNLPKSVAEPIEKLPLGEKLLIASCWTGKGKAKSDVVFEAIGKLTAVAGPRPRVFFRPGKNLGVA